MFPIYKITLFAVTSVVFVSTCIATPLDDYVNHDDGYFKYNVINSWTHKGPSHTSYLINMTSQKWLTDSDSSQSIWWHHLIVNIPDHFDSKMDGAAYMKIVGGNNENPGSLPDFNDAELMVSAAMAERTNSVTAVLKQVPNQPIVFKTDPLQLKRTEDAIIAFTWRHFIEDPSKPEWLLRMAMTKAAVKAMDAINGLVNLVATKSVNKFCVGGESKRGWTTWTTGAVDERVKCMTPIVMDELNMVKNLHHHFQSYGGWTFEFDDYYLENVTRNLDHPNTQKMADIVDPYSYRNRLTMPKMIFSTGSDEFFLLDDSYYYLSDMKGANYLSMLPNTDHSCDGKETALLDSISTFYVSSIKEYKLPTFSWVLNSTKTEGTIYVQSDMEPSIVRAWYAVSLSSTRRDFRRYKLNETHPMAGPVLQPVLWVFDSVQRVSNLEYSVRYPAPKTGWIAFFIQVISTVDKFNALECVCLINDNSIGMIFHQWFPTGGVVSEPFDKAKFDKMTFAMPGGSVIEFTTETNIVPNVFPFPDCSGESCFGKLV